MDFTAPASVSQEILQKREQKDYKSQSTRKSVVKQSLPEIAAQTRPDPMTNSKGENPMGVSLLDKELQAIYDCQEKKKWASTRDEPLWFERK